jgi:hypothetical protein
MPAMTVPSCHLKADDKQTVEVHALAERGRMRMAVFGLVMNCQSRDRRVAIMVIQ